MFVAVRYDIIVLDCMLCDDVIQPGCGYIEVERGDVIGFIHEGCSGKLHLLDEDEAYG